MLWLVNLENVPPGEYWYRQTDGITHSFDHTPLIKELAVSVSDFRKANKLGRSDYQSSLYDVIAFTAARLGPNTEWTTETNEPWLPQQSSGCSGCGARIG